MVYEAQNISLSITPSTPNDYYKDYSAHIVEGRFDDSISIKTIQHNGNEKRARVVNVFEKESPTRRMQGYQKIIFDSLNNEVSVGDMFEFDNFHWLCVDVSSSPLVVSCLVAKCRSKLHIYHNNSIHDVYVVVEFQTNLHKLGIDTNKYMSEPLTTIIVRMPNNEITSNIKHQGIYKIGRNNYKVTDVIDILDPGMLVVKMEFTQEQQVVPSPIPTPPSGILVFPLGKKEIRVGQTMKFIVGKIDEEQYIIWYEDSEIDLDKLLYEDDEYQLDEESQVFLSEIFGEYHEFDFEIIAPNVPANAYTLTKISHNECTITAHKFTYYITLRVTEIATGEFVDKEIRLRSIL